MTTATMEASYQVIDEELEATPKKTKGRKGMMIGEESEATEPSQDTQAEEMAKLMQDMANKASELAFNSSLERASKMSQEVLAACEKRIAELSAQYVKPRNLCLHVKINDAPIKKLKQRVSPLIAEVMMQLTIGIDGGKWPYIAGPTGSGKTVLGRQVAEVLEKPFRYINCSEGMGETTFFGKETVKGFVPGPLWISATQGGIFMFDEFDRINDNTASSVNTIITSPVGSMITNPFSGESLPVHKDFGVIACANTNGKGGDGAITSANRLCAATLNRFAQFELGYDCELEREICPDTVLLEKLWSIRVALQGKNSKDVISTRDIADAYAQAQRGYPLNKILLCLARRMDKSNQELFTVAEEKKGKKS